MNLWIYELLFSFSHFYLKWSLREDGVIPYTAGERKFVLKKMLEAAETIGGWDWINWREYSLDLKQGSTTKSSRESLVSPVTRSSSWLTWASNKILMRGNWTYVQRYQICFPSVLWRPHHFSKELFFISIVDFLSSIGYINWISVERNAAYLYRYICLWR